MPLRQQGDSQQVRDRPGKALYELVDMPLDEPDDACRYCDTPIVKFGDRWYALYADWPNLAHCHYSGADRTSVGHEPKS